jgi:hypothetical protein
MLRLTRGTEVEVLSKKADDCVLGAWVGAEVISTSLYTCTVRYGGGRDGIVEETVPRGDVRPLPPPLEGAANFTPGDFVECRHSFTWRTAKILKAVSDNIFLVRFLGDLNVGYVVHKSVLRVRQRWTSNRWYVLGKNSAFMCECAKENNPSPMKKDIGLDDDEDSESSSESSDGSSSIGEAGHESDDRSRY